MYLIGFWENEHKHSCRDFLERYNKKDVVPFLDAMLKTIEGYHNKGNDVFKLGCTLPILAKFDMH